MYRPIPPPLSFDISVLKQRRVGIGRHLRVMWAYFNLEKPGLSSELVQAIQDYRQFCTSISSLNPHTRFTESSIYRRPIRPYAERSGRLLDYYKESMFSADKLYMMLENPAFERHLSNFLRENAERFCLSSRTVDVGEWPVILGDLDFLIMVANFWEAHYGRLQRDFRQQIAAAVKIFARRQQVDQVGQTRVDRASSPLDNSESGDSEAWMLGATLLMRLRVDDVLKRVIGPQTLHDPIQLDIDHAQVKENVERFFKENPGDLQTLNGLEYNQDSKERIWKAVAFRLALYPYDCRHYDVMPGPQIPHDAWNPFDDERLKAKASASAHNFIHMLAAQDDVDAYLASNDPTSTEALWGARMKILLPSLKLAQKGGRIHFQNELKREEELRVELARYNNVLGEMGVTVRQGGKHLTAQLQTELTLFESVLKEKYGRDQELVNSRMDYFERHVSHPDSFIISVGMDGLFSAGLVLVSKIDDDPVTYSIEALYVEKSHRRNYHLGLICENIARSLIDLMGGVRIVSTVYTQSSSMVRHLKHGAVGTSLSKDKKLLGLHVYDKNQLSEEGGMTLRAENHAEFLEHCKELYGQLVLAEVVPDHPDVHSPPFPCQMIFKHAKTIPKGGFYTPD